MRTLKAIISITTFLCFSSLQAHEIRVHVADASEPAGLKPNLYLLYHNLQEHLLDHLDLDITPQQTSGLVKLIAENAAFNTANLIVIPQFKDESDLRISFRLMQGRNGTVLTLLTNYSPVSGKLVSTISGSELATMLYWRDPFFIYYKDDYSSEREKTFAKNPLRLANYYILDGNAENDERVESLLAELIKGESYSPLDKFVATLTKGQFCLSKGDLECAQKIESSTDLDNAKLSGIEKDIGSRIFEIFKEEILVTQHLLN